MTNAFKDLPNMNTLLHAPALQGSLSLLPHAMGREILRQELDTIRQELRTSAAEVAPTLDDLLPRLDAALRRASDYHHRPLINATGIVLHTNLGRAPLGEDFSRHIAALAQGYSNLEYRLEIGARGSRFDHVVDLLCRITGAEDALVVNNNAAAVFLMLNTLASGRSVAVSRGELVEIGGAFRVPEIMSQSGATLMEIGTTNKTRPADYLRALDSGAGAILKVHASNFKLLGFTEEATLQQLAPIAQAHQVPLLYDVGSGFLVRPESLNLHEGLYIPDLVPHCDVLCFSGDKLLGGPQAGILLGKRQHIRAMKQNHLSRMLRIDKLTLAALEAVLRWYLDEKAALTHIPTLSMLHASQTELLARAQSLAARLRPLCPNLAITAEPCLDEPGGGSLPGVTLDGAAVVLRGTSPDALEEALRLAPTPIITRIHRGALLLSLRTIAPQEEEALIATIAGLC